SDEFERADARQNFRREEACANVLPGCLNHYPSTAYADYTDFNTINLTMQVMTTTEVAQSRRPMNGTLEPPMSCLCFVHRCNPRKRPITPGSTWGRGPCRSVAE